MDLDLELIDRTVASLHEQEPAFDWVGVYFVDGDTLVLGPFRGEPTEHERIAVGHGVWGAVARRRASASRRSPSPGWSSTRSPDRWWTVAESGRARGPESSSWGPPRSWPASPGASRWLYCSEERADSVRRCSSRPCTAT